MDELRALKLVLSWSGEAVEAAYQQGKITAGEAEERKEMLHQASNILFDLLILREEAEQETMEDEYPDRQHPKRLLN